MFEEEAWKQAMEEQWLSTPFVLNYISEGRWPRS